MTKKISQRIIAARMAERSKALCFGRSPLLWACVRIPLLTNTFYLWKSYAEFNQTLECLLFKRVTAHDFFPVYDFCGKYHRQMAKILHIVSIRLWMTSNIFLFVFKVMSSSQQSLTESSQIYSASSLRVCILWYTRKPIHLCVYPVGSMVGRSTTLV